MLPPRPFVVVSQHVCLKRSAIPWLRSGPRWGAHSSHPDTAARFNGALSGSWERGKEEWTDGKKRDKIKGGERENNRGRDREGKFDGDGE